MEIGPSAMSEILSGLRVLFETAPVPAAECRSFGLISEVADETAHLEQKHRMNDQDCLGEFAIVEIVRGGSRNAGAPNDWRSTVRFAQAAIQEPGVYALYHPGGDVLNAGRPKPKYARLNQM
jgi:hypothetical protein